MVQILWIADMHENKNHKNFLNDITIIMGVAISRVAMKQSAKRESYARFTHGILLPSLP